MAFDIILRERLRARYIANRMRPNYVFVSGIARSGTTALRMSLGLHPELYSDQRENMVVADILHQALLNRTLPDRIASLSVSPEAFDRAFERLFNELIWSGHAECPSRLRMGAFHIMPMTRDYFFQIFPNSKVVYLVRNGIQVISSRKLHNLLKLKSFDEHCTAWLRSYKMYKWGLEHPDEFFLVRHEWLIDRPKMQAVLQQLYGWLEIRWDDAPLVNLFANRYGATRHSQEELAQTADYARLSLSERQLLEQTRSERWRFWTGDERAMFEERCGQAMREMGYSIPWRTRDDASNRDFKRTLVFGQMLARWRNRA